MALTERDRTLIADLEATFPGIWTRDAAEYRCPLYQDGIQIGPGDHGAEMGGLPIFSTLACNDPDEYNGGVLHAFETWLANRGYRLEEYDALVFFAVPVQPALLQEAG